MAEPLFEAEALCREVVTALNPTSGEDRSGMARRVEALLPKIVESRKKIMMKSPKGRELTAAVLDNAKRLHELATGSNLGEASSQLGLLEGSVGKMEIYWKSFEYVTT